MVEDDETYRYLTEDTDDTESDKDDEHKDPSYSFQVESKKRVVAKVTKVAKKRKGDEGDELFKPTPQKKAPFKR